MQWNNDARSAVAKAPLFVRGMITRRVDEHVRKQGRDIVTLEDVMQVRAGYLDDNPAQVGPEDSAEMSADRIESIVRRSSPQIVADERTYEVKVCGLPGCPRRIFDVHQLAEKMVKVIEASGVEESVVRRVNGPILRHHRFTISISGCPNSCSQPQIADFGVQGRARPEIGPGECTGCGACVGACREDAVAVSCNVPRLDMARCINCGDCTAVCPTQALVVGEIGFTALVGGKLGRNPRLARTLFDFADQQTLLNALQACSKIFAEEVGPRERFSDAVDRVGVDEIARRCVLI